MRRWSILLILSCSSTSPELLVDVVSDLQPVSELTTVEVTLLEGTRVVAGADYVVVPADELSVGVRVAELQVASGTYTLRVRGLGSAGELVGEVTQLVALDRRLGVTVRFDSACVGVMCPRAGDPRTFTACVAGVCVAPACVEDPLLCASDASIDASIDATVDALDSGVDADMTDAPSDVGEDAGECPETFGMACGSVTPCCSTQVCASREDLGEPRLCTNTCVVGSDIDIRSSSQRPRGRGGCGDGLTCVWSGGSGLDGYCGPTLAPPDQAMENIGKSCTSSAECWSPFGWGFCLQYGSGTASAGVCTVFDCDAPVPVDDRGQGLCGTAVCASGGGGAAAFCVAPCMGPEDCDPGIACSSAPAMGTGFCLPYCSSDVECRGRCIEEAGGGIGLCDM